MPDFKVIGCAFKKDVQLQHGAFKVYALTLEAPGGGHVAAELMQKPETAAPAEGSVLTGTVEQTQYGMKFKKQPPAFGGGGGRAEDPRRGAMILRQHSQAMSLQYAELRLKQGTLPADFSLTDLAKVTDWFDADARKAGDAA
jgi:hypothetical protein